MFHAPDQLLLQRVGVVIRRDIRSRPVTSTLLSKNEELEALTNLLGIEWNVALPETLGPYLASTHQFEGGAEPTTPLCVVKNITTSTDTRKSSVRLRHFERTDRLEVHMKWVRGVPSLFDSDYSLVG